MSEELLANDKEVNTRTFNQITLGQLYYNVGNAFGNFGNTWAGKSATIGGDVMNQPEMLKASDYRHTIPDVKAHHMAGVKEAAGSGTSA